MRRAPIFQSAEAAEEAFYDAMRRADLEAMMTLWADDDEVACTHPGQPRLVGLDAVRASWAAIFAHGAVDARPTGVLKHNGPMLAVHSLIERVTVAGQSGAAEVGCVATNVYVKYPSGWRILLHQSGPATDEPAAPSAATVLH